MARPDQLVTGEHRWTGSPLTCGHVMTHLIVVITDSCYVLVCRVGHGDSLQIKYLFIVSTSVI